VDRPRAQTSQGRRRASVLQEAGMDFSFTEEQSMLRDTLQAYLADHYGLEARRTAVASEAGWRPEIWKAFAQELGILGAAFPEDLGGLGGGPTETHVIVEAFGEALVLEPYVGTVVIGGGLLQQSRHVRAAELIGGIIAGDVTMAFAGLEAQARYAWWDLQTTARRDGSGWLLNGRKAVVVGMGASTHVIVSARTSGGQRDLEGVSLFLVDMAADGLGAVDYPTVDGGRAAEVAFENVRLPAEALIGPEGQGAPLLEQALDEAVAAHCAEACGVLRRLHEGTLEYTRQRKQFGQPISSVQALQHRMADMFMQVELASSLSLVATLRSRDPDPVARGKAVSAAKVQVGKALRFVGQSAIQLHGGMGMTDEMAIGHYFKRGTMIEGLFGSTDHHLARYERLSFAV
jgi:alkylation response protein AidB-like acyl-CoA dehydrogenase